MFFAIGLLMPALAFFAAKNRPYMQIVLNEVGLTIPYGIKCQLTIDWNDITELVTDNGDQQYIIGIKVKDPDKYISMMTSNLQSFGAKSAFFVSGCSFSIVCTLYGMKRAEMIKLMQPYLKGAVIK